jgi:hypothetical protein
MLADFLGVEKSSGHIFFDISAAAEMPVDKLSVFRLCSGVFRKMGLTR